MNKKAKKLGLTHTSFDNPIGLDIGSDFHKTYTTANDFAILGRVAMSNGTIRRIVSKGKYKINKSRIKNTNLFYDRFSLSEDSKYKIIGTKTGTTRAAGKVLIATAVDEKGHEVICAFFGNSTSEALYQDIKKLFDFTFSKNHKGKLELSKGFWDTRYTSNEELIRDYANDELIFGTNGKFNPKKELSAKKAARLINEITGLNLKAKELKSMTKEEAVVYADSLL